MLNPNYFSIFKKEYHNTINMYQSYYEKVYLGHAKKQGYKMLKWTNGT